MKKKKKKKMARAGRSPAPKGESGAPPLAGDGDDGAELDSLRGEVMTDSAAGRSMVMLRVTAGVAEPEPEPEPAAAAPSAVGDGGTAAADDDEGEKEAYLRSLPRPESGRGPATVSSHSWSRSPMHRPMRASVLLRACVLCKWPACVVRVVLLKRATMLLLCFLWFLLFDVRQSLSLGERKKKARSGLQA